MLNDSKLYPRSLGFSGQILFGFHENNDDTRVTVLWIIPIDPLPEGQQNSGFKVYSHTPNGKFEIPSTQN
jgi:hypothetical protein